MCFDTRLHIAAPAFFDGRYEGALKYYNPRVKRDDAIHDRTIFEV
jgi:hypothetical protein